MKKRFSLLISLLGLFVLAGCGSDSGSSALTPPGDPNPPPVAVDDAPVGSIILLPSATQISTAGGDSVDLTAIVKDTNNGLVSGVKVIFAANNNGAITVSQQTTDQSGKALASLTAAGDQSNRTITVGATVIVTQADGTELRIEDSVQIDVFGTVVEITGPTSSILNQNINLELAVVDSAGSPIPEKSLSVTSANGNTISNPSPYTGSTGRTTISLTADYPGTDTITVSAPGATPAIFTLEVFNEAISFTSPAVSPTEVNVNTAFPITLNWPNGEGQTISFAATRGTLAASSATISGGTATVNISSAGAGISTISVTTASGLSINTSLLFVATTPTTMTLQPSPSAISVTPIGGAQQSSKLLAVVRDATGNLVKNQTVNFEQVIDTTGGQLSSASAITDEFGRASVDYLSSPTASSFEGITIKAFLASNPAIYAETKLTVGARALSINMGGSNVIFAHSDTVYRVPYTVIVTDANGGPVANTNVTLSVLPEQYYGGYWIWAGIRWVHFNEDGPYQQEDLNFDGTIIPSEDLNCNDVLDLGEDVNGNGNLDLGEDLNCSGLLEPGNVATFTPQGGQGSTKTVVVTDSTGLANLDIYYPKVFATWVRCRLIGTTVVDGTESSRFIVFKLPIADSDVNLDTKAPPSAEGSPFNWALGLP